MPPRKQPSAKQILKPKPRATTKRKPAAKKKSNPSEFPKYTVIALILLSPFYYGYVLKMASSSWRWLLDIGEDQHYRKYRSFNIRIPTRYKIHGIDVSYAQGKINWQRVAAMEEDSVRIKFAFIKATEGLLTVDPYFKRNWREAPKVGITCGAYHFFRPKKNGLWQARFFLQNVNVEAGDLPCVVDIERLDGTSPQNMRKELTSFIKHIEKHTGAKPIIYTGLSFYKDYLDGYFDSYPLWIAHYNQQELKMADGTNWQFWQHSETARIDGINHTVDFDAFRGDSTSFYNLLLR
ncbi:glycoside hydrolase family 25 protein [Mucilaginibacter pallidiroseus]|uniref:Glycoside hydrolase family 25 protein n=1 Tax=Mucilaginibacter pallidiroseus TaxID=2599295 RepID=A0A563UC40_9SPHI|nr:glycoside hydrolase family 25 protein [Mucilaginibacter pallidiroseus]TWR28942.1 glycoside hydrolase family 25 protein [Mucilaginibacter pallidiroseus]